MGRFLRHFNFKAGDVDKEKGGKKMEEETKTKEKEEKLKDIKKKTKEFKKKVEFLVKSGMSQKEKVKQAESIHKQIWKEIEWLNAVKGLKEKQVNISNALLLLLEMNNVNKLGWQKEIDKKEFEERNVTESQSTQESKKNNTQEQMSNGEKLKRAKKKIKKIEKAVKSLAQEQENKRTSELLEKGKTIRVEMFRLLDEMDNMENIGDDLMEKRQNIERALILVCGINDANIDIWEKRLHEEMNTLEERESSIVKGAPQNQEKPSETSDEDILADTKKKTKKFEETVRAFKQDGGNEKEELKRMKSTGLEMLRLLERMDAMQNVRKNLREKRKQIVTTLNLVMDLNEANIELLEKELSMRGKTKEDNLGGATTTGKGMFKCG